MRRHHVPVGENVTVAQVAARSQGAVGRGDEHDRGRGVAIDRGVFRAARRERALIGHRFGEDIANGLARQAVERDTLPVGKRRRRAGDIRCAGEGLAHVFELGAERVARGDQREGRHRRGEGNAGFHLSPPMIRRLAYLGAVLATIMAAPAGAQQADTFETKKAQATGLFLHGKVNAAIGVQRDVIAAAPSPHEKGLAQRDLMEMCATVQDWDCAARTMRTLLPIVRSDPQLAPLELDILAYAAKHALWRQDDAALAAVLRDGGAATVHTLANPAAAATLALALQDSSIRRNDLKSAESQLSTAILGLLLSDQYGAYRRAELSVGVLQALLNAEDIVGAMTLANMLAPILPKLAPGDSVVAARYLILRAHLSAYTEKYSATAEAESLADLVTSE